VNINERRNAAARRSGPASITEHLKAVAQAIDELFPDQAGARDRYLRLMAGLHDSGKASLSSAATSDSVASARQPASDNSVLDSEIGRELTDRQRKIIQVIRDSVQRRGYPPSMREIGEAVGLSSISSVAHQLMALERKGFLRRDTSRPRSYEVRSSTQTSPSRLRKELEASMAFAAKDAQSSDRNASDQSPVPEAHPGEEVLKEQVRVVWGEVEKLRRDSDEQRRYLHRKPLTNADLAQRIGKSVGTVSRWLRDKTFMPSRKEFLSIVEMLGGDPDEFDFLWYEGYTAYEVLKGMSAETLTAPGRHGEARRLLSATDG
jgi:transcriptional regulator with XRE-family HTH domain